MHIRTVLTTLLLSACVAGGTTGPAPTLRIIPPDDVTLVEGQSVEVALPNAPAALFIRFAEVVGDSRCPRGVQCVWAGDAAIRLALSGLTAGEVVLHAPTETVGPRAATAGVYRIELLSVTPTPVYQEPRPRPYRVSLRVTMVP